MNSEYVLATLPHSLSQENAGTTELGHLTLRGEKKEMGFKCLKACIENSITVFKQAKKKKKKKQPKI